MQRDDKRRRKEILHALRDGQRREVLAGLPAPVDLMSELFGNVEQQLTHSSCDHTFRCTNQFIASKGLPEDRVLEWLRHNGGYCDCEALANSHQVFEDAQKAGK